MKSPRVYASLWNPWTIKLVVLALVIAAAAGGMLIGHRYRANEDTVVRLIQVPVEHKIPVGGKRIGHLVRSFAEAGCLIQVYTATGPREQLVKATREFIDRAKDNGIRIVHASVKPRVRGYHGGPITPKSRYLGIIVACVPGVEP